MCNGTPPFRVARGEALGNALESEPRSSILDAASARPAPDQSITTGLRVVMIVANDVTRDSRVLREAAVLAACGHRVTILGIMTARTTAPETELRDGFVIRRLRYRARPPGWWVPPDFYARIRYRAGRQHRIHRARLVALARNARRELRLLRARIARTSDLGQPLRGASAMARDRRVILSRRAHVLLVRAHRAARWAASLPRRARRAPPEAWSRKARQLGGLAGAMARGRARRNRSPRWTGASRPRWSERWSLAFRSLVISIVRAARAVGRGLRAWFGILGLLAWGSVYLLADRFTRGALEWQTGWRWRWMGWAQYLAAHAPDADVWHGHDMTSLPAIVALKRRRGGLAVYDSHEVYLESGRHAEQPRWAKAPMEALERRLVAEVDAIVTVNRSLAEILARRLGASDIHVLHNCPPRTSRPMGDAPLRRTLMLPDATPLLLYHGSLAPHRGVEQLLAAITRPELRSAHLAFLGFGPLIDWLRHEARDPRFGGRVHVLDAVAPDELAAWIHGVDVAVAPIQASTLNHRYSSPNKVFEAIAAGTPVAGSDFPEFRRVINDPDHGPLGALFDPSRPDEIARVVRAMLDAEPAARAALRRRCRDASERRWNWETESRSLVALYDGFAATTAAARNHAPLRVGAA